MAAPSPPPTTEEPSLSISSGSSSFLIRANPTHDSDVESSFSLKDTYNGSDSDYESQMGSDTGENEFPPPPFGNGQNPDEKVIVFDGDKEINGSFRASATHDSDIEGSLSSSNYNSTQEEDEDEEEGEGEEQDVDEEEEEEEEDDVGKANEVIPIRARLTRESDDDDLSIESGEIDNDYGFLSAVRMPVRISSTAIEFEEEEDDDRELGIEPPASPPPAMEDVPEKEASALFLSEQSITTKESGTDDAAREFHVNDNEDKKEEQTLISEITDPIINSSIEALDIEQTLISETAASNGYSSVKTHCCLNPIAYEDSHNSPKDDEHHDIGTLIDKDWANLTRNSVSKPNGEDERKKLVKFFRFVLRLGLSPEDSLVQELLFHQLKNLNSNSNLQAAKEEAIHLEQQKCQTDFISSLNILVIGKTGVGKSATINSIFAREMAKVDAFQPGTKSVTAISGSINSIKLTIFDTPGFRAEHSINKKIILSIKRGIRKSPPDIVLYVDRFDEQTPNQDNLSLLRSISSLLGSSIWNSTMFVFTHAESNPLDEPSQVFKRSIFETFDERVILVENNHPINIESWRRRLLLLGYSMKLSLSETEHLPNSDMEFAYPVHRNRRLWLLEKDCPVGEDDAFMSLFVMKLKMDFEATLSKSKGGKVLLQIRNSDHQLQIALFSMLSLATAVFRRIFTDKHNH